MTQSQLNRLLVSVIEEVDRAGIPRSSRISPDVVINRRAKTRLGCCRTRNGQHTIEISAALPEADEYAIRQTLAHEVLHTCPGCANHGPRWKAYAARMNTLYGYAIRATVPREQLGELPVRFLVVCRACGREIPRMKRSPLVDHPERYRCRCGGTLYVTRPGQSGRPSVK